MSQKANDNLKDLEERLNNAQANKNISPVKQNMQKSMSYGLRIGIEMVIAISLGVAIGIFFDRLLNTSPFLMIFFLFLGFAAGINNIVKHLNSLNEDKKS
jgi:ATP synthase protein I